MRAISDETVRFWHKADIVAVLIDDFEVLNGGHFSLHD